MIKANIVADSVNSVGNRLVTFELTYPRFIHAEIMTHRQMSRNAASSRAIPVKKMMDNISMNPAMPEYWGLDKTGMQSGAEATEEQIIAGKVVIDKMRAVCLNGVRALNNIGFHKQLANRYIEPWMHITVIASMTSFEHFRRLRNHPMAEPHFQDLARQMCKEYDLNEPDVLQDGDWHLPYTGFKGDEDLSIDQLIKVSTARCARVSYKTHDGVRNVEKDFALHDSLSTNGHWSPFEHPAQAHGSSEQFGNFTGFKQHRKFFSNEFIPDQLRGKKLV